LRRVKGDQNSENDFQHGHLFSAVGIAEQAPFYRRFRLPLLLLAAVVVCAAVILQADGRLPQGYLETAREWWHVVQEDWRFRFAAEDDPGVTLHVIPSAPALRFEWSDSDSPAPAVARKSFLKVEWKIEERLTTGDPTASLEIQDGGERLQFSLDTGNLAQGSRTYFPNTGDVRLRLLVQPETGSVAVTTVRFFAPRTGGPEHGDSAPLEAALVFDVEALKQVLRQQRQENEKLAQEIDPPRRSVSLPAIASASQERNAPQDSLQVDIPVLIQKVPAIPPTAIRSEQ